MCKSANLSAKMATRVHFKGTLAKYSSKFRREFAEFQAYENIRVAIPRLASRIRARFGRTPNRPEFWSVPKHPRIPTIRQFFAKTRRKIGKSVLEYRKRERFSTIYVLKTTIKSRFTTNSCQQVVKAAYFYGD